MMFREGSFEQIIYNRLPLIRQVTYKQMEVDNIIWKIRLSQYSNDEISITLIIDSEPYQNFMENMVSQGIPRPSSAEQAEHTITIRAARTQQESFQRFLSTIKACLPRFENIHEYLDEIMISITQASQVADDVSATNQNTTQSQPHYVPLLHDYDGSIGAIGAYMSLFQHILLTNTSSSTSIRLLGDEYTDRVLGAREEGNSDIDFYMMPDVTTATYDANNTQDHNLNNALQESFAGHYGHTSATYLPSRNNAEKAPALTEEEHKLFKEAEDKGYTCPISLEIMTDPVSIKGHEKSGTFERSAIKNWLETNNRHPLTNVILTDKTLVSNTELQTAIEGFKTSKLKI